MITNDKWEFYKDAEHKWRWRRTSTNGNIVGASTEGYTNKADCEGNARRSGYKKTAGSGSAEIEDAATEQVLIDHDKQEQEIENKAYELYKERGFKEGNEFVLWLETERALRQKIRTKHHTQIRNMLTGIVLILLVIVAILLLQLFKKDMPVILSEQSLAKLQVMMLVLDPKEDEQVVVFGDTHFNFNESALSDDAKMLLDKDVANLKANPKIHVRMAGYTSAKGTEEFNQQLSEDRANVVREYLIENGIAPERITVIGYGRTRPAVYEVRPGDKSSAEALANMRVLFEVVVQ
jgi:outer membrane protein OmpA-like peptidoglycan-associated protein